MAHKTVGVKFRQRGYNDTGVYESKIYTYLTDLSLEVGDYVVVDTPKGLEIVKVVTVDVTDPSKATKFIVCKVSLDDYMKLTAEAAAKATYEKEMKSKIASFEMSNYYSRYVGIDPEFDKLYEAYKNLG